MFIKYFLCLKYTWMNEYNSFYFRIGYPQIIHAETKRIYVNIHYLLLTAEQVAPVLQSLKFRHQKQQLAFLEILQVRVPFRLLQFSGESCRYKLLIIMIFHSIHSHFWFHSPSLKQSVGIPFLLRMLDLMKVIFFLPSPSQFISNRISSYLWYTPSLSCTKIHILGRWAHASLFQQQNYKYETFQGKSPCFTF